LVLVFLWHNNLTGLNIKLMHFIEIEIVVLKASKGGPSERLALSLSIEVINKSLIPQSINHLSQVTMCVSVSDI
jgi:hypothetical protein